MTATQTLESRARQRLGTSEAIIYETVAFLLAERQVSGAVADWVARAGARARLGRIIGIDLFTAFQDAADPAQRTALLEVDCRRIAAECGLDSVDVRYTCSGRVPLTPVHYPRPLARAWPRGLSDNVALVCRRLAAGRS